jgi:hypothetical protein
MRKLLGIAAALAAAGCAADAQVEADRTAMAERTEASLAEQLRGYRPAGPPLSCVNLRQLHGNRSAGEGAIVFRASGGRLYVNRPAAGCPQMQFGRHLQFRTTTSQICRGEIVTVVEPSFGGDFGSCVLGDFEPYRKAR